MEVDYGWDELNRLTRVTTSRSGENLASFEYAYDNNRNRIAENRTIGGDWEKLEYFYDNLNQLIEVKGENQTENWVRLHTYYSTGNRVRMEENVWVGGQLVDMRTENYFYDAANQLEDVYRSDGSFTTFAYDNNGNMVEENRYDNQSILVENRAYFYDFNDRLVKVGISRDDNSAQVIEYEYDPLGNRTARRQYDLAPDGTIENENVLYYLNDVSGPLTQVLGTYDNLGNPVQNFMYGINRFAAFGQENYYFISDGLGSVWGLVDGNGNLVENYSYDEWGVPRRWAGGLNTFGFTGEDYDPVTGLVFLRARYYKPDIGRFITQDDTLGSLKDPLTWNFYIYARNSPATLTDPSGRFIWWLVLAIFLVGATGGAVYYHITTPPEQRTLLGYLGWAVLGGALALGGAAAASVFTSGATMIGLTGFKAAVVGGIATGAVMGFTSQVIFNVIQGRDWTEDLIESTLIGPALGGLIGATGFYAAKIPGLKIVGRAPALQWKFFVSYMGLNTYRYLGQKIFGSVLRETVRYESKYIERIYSQKLSIGW